MQFKWEEKLFSDKMGHSTSKNMVTDINNQLNSVLLSNTQSCTNSLSQAQILDLQVNNGNITLSGDTWNQSVSVNAQCLQSLVSSTTLTNDMNTQVQQTAQATNTSLSLTGTNASNVTNAIQQLGNAIVSAYSAQCANITNQSQVLQLSDGNGNIVIVDTNFNQTQTGFVSCVQQNTSVIQANNNLQQVIGQYAKSTTSSLWLIIIAAVIGLVILAVIVGIVIIAVKGQKHATQIAQTPAGQEVIRKAPELLVA